MWWRISVEKYQNIKRIQATTSDDIDRVAYLICVIYNKKESDVNLWAIKKFIRYTDKLNKLFKTTPKAFPFFSPRLQTDASKITLGQFVELQYWIKGGVVFNLHFIAATLLNKKDHEKERERMLKKSITSILFSVSKFFESWQKLLTSYSNLFEIGEDPGEVHPFSEQYGWIYSATKVAELEGITLDKAYDLPIIQALNDLAFLKSKQKFEQWQQEQ